VKDRPDGVGDDDLRLALAEGWGIETAALRYAAVGGGSYHWAVRDGTASRWFVTVDDLDDKAWLGDTQPAVLAGLRAAMNTALALRREAGLGFVVAPVPGSDGATVQPLGPKHAVTVFAFRPGIPGRFGEALPAAERTALVDMLAGLHQSTLHRPAPAGAPTAAIGLPRREALGAALGDLGRPWRAGPFAEPARTLLAGAAVQVRGLLESFDRLAGAVRASEFVITHGEPHPGNVIRAGPERLLIDWDTVGLAPPERDLWWVVSQTGEEARRYADLTGRAVNAARLAMYRLRWALDDISIFVSQLRAEHHRASDTEHAWLALKQTVAGLTSLASDC
jgi:spectinomycin phosphotransferase